MEMNLPTSEDLTMADEEMIDRKMLTEEQLAKATKWINARVKQCPVCNHPSMTLGDCFFVMQAAGGIRGTSLLMLCCDSCGYILSFMAHKMGFVELAQD